MSQQLVAPNRLGQVLGYLSNAVAYANYVRASSNELVNGKKKGFFGALAQMASRDAWSGSETMDVESIYKLAITSAWFYSGVKLIADRVANDASMFKVKERIGEELRDLANHAFEILITSPNSLMTYDFIMVYSVLWYYLKGKPISSCLLRSLEWVNQKRFGLFLRTSVGHCPTPCIKVN